jgi:nitrite reductase (NO-forming)/hydroxylamine reductase
MQKPLLVLSILAFLTGAFVFSHTGSVAVAAADGKAIYDSKCAACHQATGQGVTGAFPPLAGNPNVTGDAKKVIATVVKGMSGSLTVAGKTYNGAMPAWKGQFSNAEMAAVITYIRTSWGNKGSAVTEKQVAAVK